MVPKKVILYLFLIVTGLITLAPLIWMLSASFMADGHANVYPPRFFPDKITFIQYESLLSRLSVARNFFNSLFLAISVTLISLVFNSMAGYAFAKYRFKGKNQLFKLLRDFKSLEWHFCKFSVTPGY
jgi:multiple sugar transport system permease protein